MSEANPQSDDLIGRTEEAERKGGGGRAMQAANLFDLRRIIGGLFLVYGVILTIVGIGDSSAAVSKAAGVHINLVMGIAMLILGVLFLIWAFSRPLGEQLREAEEDERSGSPEHPAPRGTDAAALSSHQRSGRTRSDRDSTPRDPGAGP
jgi:hypothetical protein